MSERPSLTPDERRQLAAELALGLLHGDERSQAIALSREDGEFAGEVARWRGRLAPSLAEVEEIQPAGHVWEAIERGIGGAPADAKIIQLNRRLSRWRGFAAATSAVAASLALVLVMRPPQALQPAPIAQPAPMVATLASDSSNDRLVATWDPARRSLIVAAAAGMQPAVGKDHELWVIPAGGKPLAIGVMHPKRPMRMTLPMTMAAHFKTGATLAVSVEPTGGSATGLPTGPVIAAGALQQT
ncbi:MAG: anti-sigma factor [Sphingomicrobium sp.]